MDAGLIGSKLKDRIQGKAQQSLALVIEVLILASFLWVISYTPRRVFYQSDRAAHSSAAVDWNSVGPDIPSKATQGANRPVYPYSVVPGGVASAKELRTAVQQDAIVAAHYSDFHTQSARLMRLKNSRQVYVSYRVANRVYWTRKKVTLHAGETLLTDGMHLARTRCGNRISEVPAEPASSSEPTEKELSNPVRPTRPDLTTESIFPAPFWPDGPLSPLFPLGSIPPPGSPPFVPLLPPIPCCGSPSGHNPPPTPLPQPNPPPVPTPEPGALVLLISGLAVVFTLWKLHRP